MPRRISLSAAAFVICRTARAFVMRATMNLALLFTILQGASALQLRPRTRTYNTPSTRTTGLFSNYLDEISSDTAASKLAEADAAAAEADRLSSQAAALVASIKEEKETSPLPPPVAAPEPVVPEETLPAPAPAAERVASRLARVPPPAEDISSFVSETLQPEYAPETTAVAGAALLAAGAVQCINEIVAVRPRWRGFVVYYRTFQPTWLIYAQVPPPSAWTSR